jgi:hypothetical protein
MAGDCLRIRAERSTAYPRDRVLAKDNPFVVPSEPDGQVLSYRVSACPDTAFQLASRRPSCASVRLVRFGKPRRNSRTSSSGRTGAKSKAPRRFLEGSRHKAPSRSGPMGGSRPERAGGSGAGRVGGRHRLVPGCGRERAHHLPRAPADRVALCAHRCHVDLPGQLRHFVVRHARPDVAPGHAKAVDPVVVQDLRPVRDDEIYRGVLGSRHVPQEPDNRVDSLGGARAQVGLGQAAQDPVEVRRRAPDSEVCTLACWTRKKLTASMAGLRRACPGR